MVEGRSLEELDTMSLSRSLGMAANLPVQATATSQRCRSSLLLVPMLLQRPEKVQFMLKGVGRQLLTQK